MNRSNRRNDRNVNHPLDLRDDLIRDRRIDHYTVGSLMFCLKRQTDGTLSSGQTAADPDKHRHIRDADDRL